MRNKLRKSLVLGSVVWLSACSNPSVDIPVVFPEGAPEGAEVTAYEDVPGMMQAVIKNGERITTEGDLLEGKKHGSWTVFDAKGAVQSVTTYYQGKKQGVSLTFDSQGYVSRKSSYANGNLHGYDIAYKRKKISEEKYYINGVLEGVVKKYYPSGKLMEEAPYAHGKMDGIAKWYDEDGNLSLAYEYRAGELIDKNPSVEE